MSGHRKGSFKYCWEIDQRVSPLATTCRPAAGGAVVESCAASVAANGKATTTAHTMGLERQIVVLLIQRLRERVERLGLALGSHLRRRLGAGKVCRPFS